jgi:CHAT domain-containing protein/Tfp pilus assembly protein PilF
MTGIRGTMRRLGGLLLAATLTPLPAAAEELTKEERAKLEQEAEQLNTEGVRLYQQGKLPEAMERLQRALAVHERLYPEKEFPRGHSQLAEVLNNQGMLLLEMGKSGQARPYLERALAMNERLYPEKDFPRGHPDLANSLSNMGVVVASLGESAKALTYHEQALAMCQKLYPKERFKDGHPDLFRSLNNMGSFVGSLGESAKALTYHEQALAMCQKLYPKERFKDGHPDLASSLNNMGYVLLSMGESAKALNYYEQALAIRQKLYPKERFPDGHPHLAVHLGNVACVLESLGKSAKALTYYEQALAMRQKLYPKERFKDGHPDLARSLNNIGTFLWNLGESAKALTYYEQALTMCQKLYPKDRFPDGHPNLAGTLHNMGNVLASLGESAKALTYSEQALAMRQKLYPKDRFPDGHPDLAGTLHNMGIVLASFGESAKALTYHEQALAMYQKLSRREVGQRSEAQALAYCRQQPHPRDAYLCTSVPSLKTNYGSLWHGRGDILTLLQARHQQILVLKGRSEKDYNDLIEVRRKLTRLQSNLPTDANGRKDRDERLAKLTDEQDRLERKLAAALPEFKHLTELADKGPADLARELPTNAAFVDLIRYNVSKKTKFAGRSYVAFVLLPGKDAQLIDLGDAAPIDEAAIAWRKHIDAAENSLAPAKLRELVWDKIDKHLPELTKLVYLCPDGDLARIPFAALPAKKKGTILLEDYALAVVPSGPWLLGQLLYPPKASEAPDRVLAVGNVAYGKSADPKADYAALPASGRELKRVLEAFGQKDDLALSGDDATADAVRKQLPEVRYAHFATHGYFNAADLTEERKRLKKTLETWTLQESGTRLGGAGMRNLAGYTGLVFAGANAPKADDKDRGILAGLNILDLPLENLRLCVLSACETGLGELTEAEGVLGLQRSFHAAGCPNVVGSLWKVNDEATAALMTKFYYELRVKKRPPVEALREAQLTVYRHPERIPALAGERGKPRFDEAVKLPSEPPKSPEGNPAKTADTKQWAAFVLSGVGTK